MTEGKQKYVDTNGNFTHTKVTGSAEEKQKFILLLREKLLAKGLCEEEIFFLISPILTTGTIPSYLLLELVMPSCNAKFKRFDEMTDDAKDEMTDDAKIFFDLAPRFKRENS